MTIKHRQAEFIQQFIRDYEAGLIGCRTAWFEPGVSQEELDAGAQPTYVAYTAGTGRYADAIHAISFEED